MGFQFLQGDLADPGWDSPLVGMDFAGILAFAVLHHLPGKELRIGVMKQVRSLLPEGGWFIHSEWQFQHSPRLMARRLPWETIDLSRDDVDEGDTLLDWRHALPGQEKKVGLRYVHLFSQEELSVLAEGSGFEIIEEFFVGRQRGEAGIVPDVEGGVRGCLRINSQAKCAQMR